MKILNFLCKSLAITVIALCSWNWAAAQTSQTVVKNLRVEYMKDPVGIDVEQPRFSWKMESNRRNVSQTAYEITVATDDAFQNTVWMSGQVTSDKSVHIPYTGNSLQPSTRYFWKVDVTDNSSQTITSTEDAFFETGLLNAGWSGAQWLKTTTTPKNATDPGKVISGFSIETKFQITEGAAFGLLFSVIDASHYLMWHISIIDGNLHLRPHKYTGSWSSVLPGNGINISNIISTSTGNTVDPRAEHTLRIDVNGNEAATYIDGTEVSTGFQNPANNAEAYVLSRLGVRVHASDNVYCYCDDMKVTAIYDDESTAITFETDFSGIVNPFSNSTLVNERLYVEKPASGEKLIWQKTDREIELEQIALERSNITKYSVEMDFEIDEVAAGPIFGAKDASNFFMWQINIRRTSGRTLLRPHSWLNGSATVHGDIDITDLVSIQKNTAHHLRIEVDGDKASTYIDNILVDENRTNPRSGNYGYGSYGIGFRADKHDTNIPEKSFYDNIIVMAEIDENTKIMLSEDFSDPDSQPFSHGATGSVDIVNGRLYIVGPTAQGAASNLSWQQEQTASVDATPGIPLFRTEFNIDNGKNIRSARLYASGLGVYNTFINGQRTDDDELKPGWTEYRKTVFYTTTDVTGLLQAGNNVLGAYVASGWWNGTIAHGQYGASVAPGFIAKLVVEYDDETTQTIITNPANWYCSTGGAIRTGDIYNGESYDARRESNWSSPGFNDSDWYACAQNTDFNGNIKAFIGLPVRVRPELQRVPVKITIYKGSTATGTTHGMIDVLNTYTEPTPIDLEAGQTAVYDLGQNMAGWVKLKVKGEAGTRITIRFAEMLNDNGASSRGNDGPGGSLYRTSLRTAQTTLTYILKGDPEGETFQPSTTFFGFRYCDVTTLRTVEIQSLTGEVVGTAVEETATFSTSHPDVNRLYSNILWGQRSNFLSIPTDCPQRDERLGWTGDIQIFERTATYNADIDAFLRKWMGDMRDAQHENGAFPTVAPLNRMETFSYGTTAWADAGVIVPWTTYLVYGDRGILEENYDAMKRHYNYVKSLNGGDTPAFSYVENTSSSHRRDRYGDWLAYTTTSSRYISVCYSAYIALLMEKIAGALSVEAADTYAQDAAAFQTYYNAVKAYFQTTYVNSNTDLLIEDTQTAYLLALKFDLLNNRQKGIDRLQRLIANNSNKLNTGFVGTGILNQTLSEVGLTDLAYNLLLQRSNPSWLYSIDQGATTLWERWNSYTMESGFGDANMNSFNHYAYGVVGEWMYRYMGGIDADENNPGFKHIILNPSPDYRETLPDGQIRITKAEASYNSCYGTITGGWEIHDNDRVTYTIVVPANTTATLNIVLRSDQDEILENGISATSAEGVISVQQTGKKAVIELQSGSYLFETRKSISTDISQAIRNDLLIHPNPANDSFTIEWERAVGESLIGIYDATGKKVYDSVIVNSRKTTVDTRMFDKGTYLVKIDNGKDTFTGKLMIR
jgi:alpha-L-rhamnosidase